MSGQIKSKDIQTTWGTIVLQLMDDRVYDCMLPILNEQPSCPFSIKEKGSDPFSDFIAEMFSGRANSVPPLGDLRGSAFQRNVWEAISTIPRGETRNYGQLAHLIEKPKAYRAVANACGANPVPLFIPCHRIVGANKNLGGFSRGIAWKRFLISIEQAPCF